ncbi:MAG: 6-pyruvoyl-tetrahydropterin synthase-related protein [Candidatus Hydrothermarchaeaceae archaeon]
MIAIFSVFAITPLFKPEFFASHDMLAPVYRLLELDTCIKDRVAFARWFPDMYGGRGGPFFNYYSPFSYYVAEVFHLAGLGYVNSVKACYLLSFVLSGVFMHLFAKDKVGRYPAVLAGVLYMYAPYHLYDVYVRGDLAESFAFVFFPLVLYSIDRGRVVLGAVSYALLILTHNISALLFTGFLFFYVTLFRRELSLKKVLPALLFGLLLSAFYWIPALFEKHMVNIENVLIFAPEESFLGVYDTLNKIGSMPLLLALSALVISKERRTRIFGVIFFGLIFLMTPYSAFFWNLPLAAYVQFPWRLLALAALVVSLLGGIAASGRSRRTVLILSFLVVLSSFSFIGYSEHITVSSQDITRQELKNLNTGLTYGHEYLPKGARILNSVVENDVELVSGHGLLETTEKGCKSLAFEYAGDGAIARVNTYYFPGWTVYIDGKRTVPRIDEAGQMLLSIPEGRHKILLKFEDTAVRKVSVALSTIAFMALALQTVRAYRAASRPRRH